MPKPPKTKKEKLQDKFVAIKAKLKAKKGKNGLNKTK